MAKGKTKVVKKGKKKHKNKPTSKKYSKYKVDSSGKITRDRFCPRCGPGVFLMNSNNKVYCGRCHYSEFTNEKTEEKK